jgi:uncharacterized delta-60 repeat protein
MNLVTRLPSNGRLVRGLVASAFTVALLSSCGGHIDGAPAERSLDASAEASTADGGAADDGSSAAPVTNDVSPPAPSVDLSFGASGFVGGSLTWIPAGVAAASDGTLVVSGFSNDGTTPPVECVERYTSNGALDPSFGTAGVVRFGASPGPRAQSVGILPSGAIGILGPSLVANDSGAFVTRLTGNGAVDATFGEGGMFVTGAAGQPSVGLFAYDGTVYVAGNASVVRIAVNGALDASFGGGNALPAATAAALDSDGSIVVADDANIARFHADGTVDSTFAGTGAVALPEVAADAASAPQTAAVFMDGQGRVLVVRDSTADGQTSVGVLRYTGEGAIDTTFAVRGVQPLAADIVLGGAALSDGRIALWTMNGLLIVLGADGTATSSNGVQGTVNLDVLGTVISGTVDAQERLIIVGLTDDTETSQWFVRRYRL